MAGEYLVYTAAHSLSESCASAGVTCLHHSLVYGMRCGLGRQRLFVRTWQAVDWGKIDVKSHEVATYMKCCILAFPPT